MKFSFVVSLSAFILLVSGVSAQEFPSKVEAGLKESIARIRALLSADSYWLQHAMDPATDRSVRDILSDELLQKVKQLKKINQLRVDIRHLEDLLSDNEICHSFEEMLDPATNRSALEIAHEELDAKRKELNDLLSKISERTSDYAPVVQKKVLRAYNSLEPLPGFE